jgi:hypothetical protein
MRAYQSSRLAAWFAPKQISRAGIFEIIGLTLVGLVVAALLQPDDPFLLTQPFPWLWLVPLVLALRYGTPAAFGASLLLLVGWYLLPLAGLGGGRFPITHFVGGLVMTLIAGEFSDVWSSRLRRVADVNGYLGERLDALTRRHYLLRLSHDRLEHELLVKPLTLRDALQGLRRLTTRQAEQTLPEADEMLRLVSQACQLDKAGLYAVRDGRPEITPVSVTGGAGTLQVSDPLVRHALEHNLLCHVQSEGLQQDSSRYLVVAPLLTSDKQLLGLLAVERMPFLSLNEESLQFLSVLLGYYADGVGNAQAIRAVLAAVPECPIEFATELVRLHRIHQDVGIHSMLAALVIAPGPHQGEIAIEVRRQSRQFDQIWDVSLGGRRVMVTLMPLHGESAMAGYLQRTESWLHDSFGFSDFHSAGVTPASILIGAAEPPALLRSMLARCEHGH